MVYSVPMHAYRMSIGAAVIRCYVIHVLRSALPPSQPGASAAAVGGTGIGTFGSRTVPNGDAGGGGSHIAADPAADLDAGLGGPEMDTAMGTEERAMMASMGLPVAFLSSKPVRSQFGGWEEGGGGNPARLPDRAAALLATADSADDGEGNRHTDPGWEAYYASWQERIAWDFWHASSTPSTPSTISTTAAPTTADGADAEARWDIYYAAKYDEFFEHYWTHEAPAQAVAGTAAVTAQNDAEVAEVLQHLGCMLALPTAPAAAGTPASSGDGKAAPLDCVLHVVLGPHELPKGAMIVDQGMPSKSKAAKLAKLVDALASRSGAQQDTAAAAAGAAPAMPVPTVTADSGGVNGSGTDASLSVPHTKYWAQRYRFFSLFDDGVQLDEESWYDAVGIVFGTISHVGLSGMPCHAPPHTHTHARHAP